MTRKRNDDWRHKSKGTELIENLIIVTTVVCSRSSEKSAILVLCAIRERERVKGVHTDRPWY
jgi:hypothetical protein